MSGASAWSALSRILKKLHSMARPQVADVGTASNMEGSCEYVGYAVGTADKGWSLSLGVGRGPSNSSP